MRAFSGGVGLVRHFYREKCRTKIGAALQLPGASEVAGSNRDGSRLVILLRFARAGCGRIRVL